MCSLDLTPWLNFQDRLVFHPCPIKTVEEEEALRKVVNQERPPNSYCDTLYIDVDSSIQLNAILYYSTISVPESSESPNSLPKAPLVLLFHGNTQHAYYWSAAAMDLNARGYDVLIPDYRQFGKSTGPITEPGLYVDAYRWYQFSLENLKYPASQVTLQGVSIGCCMALYVASRLTAQQYHQLCLVMPFDSLYSVAKAHLGKAMTWLSYPLFKFTFDNLIWIKHLEANRVAVVFAADDKIVPQSSAENVVHALKARAQEDVGAIELLVFMSKTGGHRVYSVPVWNEFLNSCFPDLVL